MWDSSWCLRDLRAAMRVVFIRLPALRALLAFSVVMTCYVYFRVSDVTTNRHSNVRRSRPIEVGGQHDGVMAPFLQETKGGGTYTLQDGYRLEILYSSSQNEDIMVKPYPEALEVPDIRQWSQDTLPECKPPADDKLPPHSDNAVLDRLRLCGDRQNYMYEPELEAWLYDIKVVCAGRFVGYGKQVALLKEVVVDRSGCDSLRNGGERLEDVVRVGDTSGSQEEYCRFRPGLFSLACPSDFHYQFKGDQNSFLAQYMRALTGFNETVYVDDYEQTPTIALTRYEYHNIYHTVADIYNAFLGTVFMKTRPKETNVILIDAHPRDSLDNVWKRLFHSGRRINDLPRRTLYKRLLWGIPGHTSFLLNYSGPPPPYLNEFVEFVLNGYAIRRRPFPRDCNKLRVVLVWRRDYVSNVGNPTGDINRKIGNERELLTALRRRFPLFTIEGSHLEQLHIKTQLHKMARTDLLIGMHGAGLTHALFLPERSGLIELLPHYWTKADGHFKGLTRWRSLEYARWVNTDPENEDAEQKVTRVPPEVLVSLVEDVVKRMCEHE